MKFPLVKCLNAEQLLFLIETDIKGVGFCGLDSISRSDLSWSEPAVVSNCQVTWTARTSDRLSLVSDDRGGNAAQICMKPYFLMFPLSEVLPSHNQTNRY